MVRIAMNLETDSPPRIRALLIAALSAALIAPVWLVPYLPLQDYPDSLMQAAILSNLGHPDLGLEQLYRVRAALPPRLASLSAMLLLTHIVHPEVAGKLTITIYLLLFPLSVTYLFRAVQRRASSAELVGFLLLYNFWFFQGSLDYLLGMTAAFFALGYVLRHRQQTSAPVLARVAALSILCYLAHIMAYVTVVLVAGLLWLTTPGRRWQSARLVAAASIPGLVLLGIHLVLSGEHAGLVQFTTSLPNKALAYVMPLLAFFRFEPFQTVLPATLANILFWSALATLLLVGLERTSIALAPHLLLVGAILLIIVLVSPVRVGQLWRFDDRLVLPTYLLLAAGLRWQRATPRQDLLLAGLTVALACLQFVQMKGPSDLLAQFNSAALPAASHEAIAALSVRDYPIAPGCHDKVGDAYSIACFPTIRFPVYQLLQTGRYNYGGLFTVGLLGRTESMLQPDLVVYEVMREQLSAYLETDAPQALGRYAVLEVFGCAADIDALVAAFPGYNVVYRAENAALLALSR